MTMFKGLLAAAISLAGITAATTADAAIVFNINNGAFRDGAALTGSFTTSDDGRQIIEFAFTTEAGVFRLDSDPNATPISTGGITYTSVGNQSFAQILSTGILITVANPGMADVGQEERTLFLNFVPARAIPNRPERFSVAERQAANDRNSRIGVASITRPAVTVSGAVPEPATWAMMLIGFGGMGFTLRRRAKVTARIRFA